MRDKRFLLAISVLLAAVVASSGQRCPVGSCSQNDPNLPLVWLNSSTSASYARGSVFRIYSRTSTGQIFADAYTQINITNIREQQATDGSDVCNKADLVPEIIRGNYQVLRDLDWSQMCCATSTRTELVNGNVNRSSATTTVTWPEYPDFIANFTLYLVNDTITRLVEGTPDTLGLDYNVTYANDSQKLTFQISNWPWLAENATVNPGGFPSYLKTFMVSTSSLNEPGTIGYSNFGTSIRYNASSPKAFFSVDYMKIITLDDVDYMTGSHADGGEDFVIGPTSYFSPPGTIVACRTGHLNDSPYWQNLSYAAAFSATYREAVSPPTPTPTAAPSPCPRSTQPSPDFDCVEGKWTATIPITSPTLVIPAGATETVVASDVLSSSIIISGLGSSIFITGCANELTEVTVNLTPSQLKDIGNFKIQRLISYANDSNCNDFSQTQVLMKVTEPSCRSAEAKKDVSHGALSAIFSVNSSKCNTWWIVLVSVICALIVAAVVVIALVAVFVPSARKRLFPFRGANRRKSATA